MWELRAETFWENATITIHDHTWFTFVISYDVICKNFLTNSYMTFNVLKFVLLVHDFTHVSSHYNFICEVIK